MQSERPSAVELISGQSVTEVTVSLEPAIRRAVSFHIYKGYFPADAKEDAIQDITLKFLEKGEDIIRQFKGHSSVKTYFNAVIFNFCSDLYRSGRYRVLGTESIERVPDIPVQAIPKKILEDEFRRLSLLFDLFGKKKHRLILCLKLTYKIPLENADIERYHPEVESHESQALLMLNHPSNVNTTDKEIFRTLNEIFNRLEEKETSVDALRKWVDVKTEEMVRFMNGDPPRYYYTRKSLQILVEKYFMEAIRKE